MHLQSVPPLLLLVACVVVVVAVPRVPPQHLLSKLHGAPHKGPGPMIAAPPEVQGFSIPIGPPGQYLYVFGANFVVGDTSFFFVGNQKKTELPFGTFEVYSAELIGVTVPRLADSYVQIQVETPHGSATSRDVFSVGLPALPPTVTSFSSSSGNVGCYLYIGGSNFFVGGGNTQVSFGGAVVVDPEVYDTDSLGITVPSLLGCVNGTVTATITTPLGSVTSTQQFLIDHSRPNKGLC